MLFVVAGGAIVVAPALGKVRGWRLLHGVVMALFIGVASGPISVVNHLAANFFLTTSWKVDALHIAVGISINLQVVLCIRCIAWIMVFHLFFSGRRQCRPDNAMS